MKPSTIDDMKIAEIIREEINNECEKRLKKFSEVPGLLILESDKKYISINILKEVIKVLSKELKNLKK